MAFDGNGSSTFSYSNTWDTSPLATSGTWHFLYRDPVAPTNDALELAFCLTDAMATEFWGFYWDNPTSSDALCVICQDSSGTTRKAQLTTYLGANTWHSIGSRISGGNVDAWYNGTQEASTSLGGNNLRTDSDVNVATHTYNGASQFAGGAIAELGIWSVDLTAAEMAALANGVSPLLIRPQSLLWYIPFKHNTTPIIQQVAYNNSGLTQVDHPRVWEPKRAIYLPSSLARAISLSAQANASSSLVFILEISVSASCDASSNLSASLGLAIDVSAEATANVQANLTAVIPVSFSESADASSTATVALGLPMSVTASGTASSEVSVEFGYQMTLEAKAYSTGEWFINSGYAASGRFREIEGEGR